MMKKKHGQKKFIGEILSFQIYLFPQRWQKNWKLESFHLNDDQVSFQKTLPNLFISTDATLELKIGKLSPGWRPTVFSKYSIKFIYFHKGDKRTENWKAFTWMATKCLFKILYQFYFFHTGHKRMENRLSPEWRHSVFSKNSNLFIHFHTGHRRMENWKNFTWMGTKCLFKILELIYLFPQRFT